MAGVRFRDIGGEKASGSGMSHDRLPVCPGTASFPAAPKQIDMVFYHNSKVFRWHEGKKCTTYVTTHPAYLKDAESKRRCNAYFADCPPSYAWSSAQCPLCLPDSSLGD